MAKPESSKHGCFSGFLRVLLCSGNGTSPPVYPSDHVEEKTQQLYHPKKNKLFVVDDDEKEAQAEASTSTPTTPGVVARLMGLDSLPNTNLVVMKGGTPDSVPRSKSVNFVDYLLKFDPSHANNNIHRRVKTSASFREVPSLNHDDDGLIVVLDQEDGARLRKNEMVMGELKQRKRQGSGSKSKEIVVDVGVKKKKERSNNNNNNNNNNNPGGGGKKKKNKKISKLRNEPRRVPSTSRNSSKVQNLSSEGKNLNKSCDCGYYYRYSDGGAGSSSSSSSSLHNRNNKNGLVEVEPKINTNMRNQQYSAKKIETECSLENLSPVSVLDINHYPFLYGTGFLEGTATMASKSKWKSLMPLSLDDGVDEKASNNKGYAYTDVNREAEYYSELMRKFRTLTEKDMRESDCNTSKRVCETDHQGFEEICLVFEHKIFDLLLYEVVNELL